MSVWNDLSAEQVASMLAAAMVAVVLVVGLLVAIAAAEARSRVGEAERVAAIRQRLKRERRAERQPVGNVDGSRS